MYNEKTQIIVLMFTHVAFTLSGNRFFPTDVLKNDFV